MVQTTRRQAIHVLIVLALLILQAGLAIASMRGKSCTLDETLHIASGLRHFYWGHGDTSFGAPTFPRFVAALSVALHRLEVKLPSPTEPASTAADQWDFGSRILHAMPGPDGSTLDNQGHGIVVAARVGIVALMLILSLVVYGFARDLLGSWSALYSMALCALSPNIIAHGTLVTTDISATLGFVGSVWGFWRMTRCVGWLNLLMTVCFLSILIHSKITGLAVVPILALTIAVAVVSKRPLPVALWRRGYELKNRAARCAILGGSLFLVPILAVVGMYGFYQVRCLAGETANTMTSRAENGTFQTAYSGDGSSLTGQMRDLVRRASDAYRSSRTHPAFLDGRISKTGFRSYFPLAFLYKSSLATLAGVGLALCLITRRALRRGAAQLKSIHNGWVPVGAFLIMYAVLSVHSTVNIGLRYILPVYGFLFVVTGLVGQWAEKRKLGKVCAGATLILAAGCNLSAYPHYLAYFNPIAGGSENGYKHLVDSNLDWGQDMILLAEYAKQRKLDVVHLSRYGSDNPDAYGMRTRSLVCYFEYKPRIPLWITCLEPTPSLQPCYRPSTM